MDVTPDLLRSFALLSTLPRSTLEELAPASRVEKIARRGIAVDPDDTESVCFLFEGRLQGIDFTIDGKEVGLFFVESGDFCGETTLFDELAKPEYVIALSQSLVVKVPTRYLRSIMLKNPHVMNLLAKRLASRIKQLTAQRSLLAISNVKQRVCCQLWMLLAETYENNAEQLQQSCEITNPPTHLEIANMLSISRESVTRVFQTLQNRQIVRRNGANSLIVSRPAELRGLAEGERL